MNVGDTVGGAGRETSLTGPGGAIGSREPRPPVTLTGDAGLAFRLHEHDDGDCQHEQNAHGVFGGTREVRFNHDVTCPFSSSSLLDAPSGGKVYRKRYQL